MRALISLVLMMFLIVGVTSAHHKPNHPNKPHPTPTPTTTFTSSPTTGFVTKSGTTLRLNGTQFTYTGVNMYNINSRDNCWYPLGYNDSKLDAAFNQLPTGMEVIRAWFYEGQAGIPGARDWAAFDHSLSVLKTHNLKVIFVLSNQGGVCLDEPRDVHKTETWYKTTYKGRYLTWVREVVSRYKNDPTILAWQLVSEPEVQNDTRTGCAINDGSILKAFADDVAGQIKSIDSNHLVTLGVIGSGQCGARGSDYKLVHSGPSIDICTVEDYDSLASIPGDSFNGMQLRINQCNELNKPIIVQEMGLKNMSLQTRANYFNQKFQAQLNAGIDGITPWNYCVDHDPAYGVCEPNVYDLMPGDPALNVIASY